MAAVGALVVLLAANTTSQLDCLCSRVSNETDGGRATRNVSTGERWMWWNYCTYEGYYYMLVESCETLEQPSPALAAAARLVPWNWREGPPPAGEGISCGPGGECDCGAALAAIRGLTREEAWLQLPCHIADALADYWSANGLNDTIWTAEKLAEDQQEVSQLLYAARSIGTALNMVYHRCHGPSFQFIGHSQAALASALEKHSMAWGRTAQLLPLLVTHVSQLFIPLALQHMGNHTNGEELYGWIKNMERVRDMLDMKFMGLVHDVQVISEHTAKHKIEEDKDRPGRYDISQAALASALKKHSMAWRRTAQLLPLLVTHVSQLFIPLAFQHMGNHTNGQELYGWIKNMERVRDMLDMKFMGLVHDVQVISEHTAKHEIEEDKDRPGRYDIRRPLLTERLLDYQPLVLSFRDEFGSLCEQQLPQASHVFGVADIVYSLYGGYLFSYRNKDNVNISDEWQVKDQSKTTVWVDTGCLQLLAEIVDRPRCPLEELPLEARQCREQLWWDLVERPPRPPVTSYLAYSEMTSVSLCLLAWMAANSRGLCQHVTFSITQSIHDATCYLESPNDQTCLQPNTTDPLCSASRAILLLKCRDFSSVYNPNLCSVEFPTTGHYSGTGKIGKDDYLKLYGKATETTLSFKETLNSATLKYRYFKVESLKPLEYSFIAINILFRLSTASIYVWLPHLRNLPGKILLSFQLTGLAQVLCSEVSYRMAGFPDVSTAALVDSCLTLLGCLWLNTFSYQMFSCVRELRLPDHLTPAEASMVFRRQLPWALIPWAVVSTACAAMEKFIKQYLLYSRITFIVTISSSVALNLVFLGLVAFIYFRNKKSMTRLNIIGDDKGFSKKQLTFMSVNTIILSGICVIIRIGFHQATGIAQYVYYVHIATMMQGPVLFVFLACNGKTLPALKNRLLSLCWPDVYRPELELCSAAEKNLARRRGEPPVDAETSL